MTPIEDESAVVTHWNITDELKARSALEETIRAKDQFIATLSHELRTPLTAIVGMTQLMREGDYGGSERSEFQETIAEQAQEVALLVEDLLVAARLDSDTLTFKPKRLNLVAEIDRVLAPWRTPPPLGSACMSRSDWPTGWVEISPTGARTAVPCSI